MSSVIHLDKVRPAVFTGKRRQVESCPARPLRWPTATKERYDLFDAWHCVAMRYARLNKVGLHFLAVARIAMIWKSGTIAASNKHLADLAGGCSIVTIKREIGLLLKLGLITTTATGRVHADGNVIRTRTIRLAFPATIDPRVRLPDAGYDEDA